MGGYLKAFWYCQKSYFMTRSMTLKFATRWIFISQERVLADITKHIVSLYWSCHIARSADIAKVAFWGFAWFLGLSTFESSFLALSFHFSRFNRRWDRWIRLIVMLMVFLSIYTIYLREIKNMLEIIFNKVI